MIGPYQDMAASLAAFTTLEMRGYIRYDDLNLETMDGRPIPVEFVSNVYEVDNKRLIQCNIRDIRKQKQCEAERKKLIKELKSSLAKVKTLSGMLPICVA